MKVSDSLAVLLLASSSGCFTLTAAYDLASPGPSSSSIVKLERYGNERFAFFEYAVIDKGRAFVVEPFGLPRSHGDLTIAVDTSRDCAKITVGQCQGGYFVAEAS